MVSGSNVLSGFIRHAHQLNSAQPVIVDDTLVCSNSVCDVYRLCQTGWYYELQCLHSRVFCRSGGMPVI